MMKCLKVLSVLSPCLRIKACGVCKWNIAHIFSRQVGIGNYNHRHCCQLVVSKVVQ
jgi:hypothetical protein